MPITLNFTANSGPELAVDIRTFVAALQLGSHPVIPVEAPQAADAAANQNEAAKSEPAKKAKEKPKPEPAKTEAPKAAEPAKAEDGATHEEALRLIKEVAASYGTGKENEEKGVAAAAKIIKSFGDAKVSKLPAEQLKPFIEECKKALDDKKSKDKDLFA